VIESDDHPRAEERDESPSAREARAQRESDVQNGRAFEWQASQDAYERWLDEINGSR
jgi:hypothetical protein